MNTSTILYILVALCSAAAFLAAWFRSRKTMEKARFVSKLTAALLFCAIAYLAATMRQAQHSIQATLMLAALTLGFMGDILLGLDHLIQKNSRSFIVVIGGVPFFLGHILYIILLLSYGKLQPWLLLLLPVIPLLPLLLWRKSIIQSKKLLTAMMAYGLVLGLMMISTWNLALQGGPLGRLMMLPGILFAISDSSLCMGMFAKEQLGRFAKVQPYFVMLPYFAAQMLFALSVVHL